MVAGQRNGCGIHRLQQPAYAALARAAGRHRAPHVVLTDQPGAGWAASTHDVHRVREEDRRLVAELPRLYRLRPGSVHLLGQGEERGGAGAEPQSLPEDLRRGALVKGRTSGFAFAVLVREDDRPHGSAHLRPDPAAARLRPCSGSLPDAWETSRGGAPARYHDGLGGREARGESLLRPQPERAR